MVVLTLPGDLLLSCTGYLDVSVSSQCGKGDSALVEQVLHQLTSWNEFAQAGLVEGGRLKMVACKLSF